MARDYKSEYKNYHSKSEQKKNRAARNGARRIMKKKYGSSILGRDVDLTRNALVDCWLMGFRGGCHLRT
jgi:hypothetical protein